MKKHPAKLVTACVVGLALVAASCGSDDEPAADTAAPEPAATEPAGADPVACETIDDVSMQLQWFTQAQFAGYYAAQDMGYYEDMCLNVTIVEGGFDITPQVQLANGDVDFATAWVSKSLATREAGANIVNIAQVFQRSGTLQVSFADSGITSPADFAGKKIGNWGFGNEFEIFAALGKEGLDPATDVELIGQQFDMVALLEGEIDAAEAMTYNEYAQVLEAENPDTGELYTPEDFNVISYEEVGVGMLQDAIWADGDRLADDPAYKDQATRFVAASLEGWTFCRDNIEACRDIVLAQGSTLGASHQLWQMNEVNKLIWPSPNGVGFIDQAAWDQTVETSLSTPNLEGSTVLTAPPTDGAFTNEIVEAAWALLGDMDLDLFGPDYAPTEVTLNAGGN
ncbi:ABC transporter substrate-binding protein [uncultured Ilumatobacter sp.]|uniref:ABC transporter substrate-binding protein n=1 Tax=uncultured Ilumatobacter sp. TaxID=879968 RepID=UPI00374EF8F5